MKPPALLLSVAILLPAKVTAGEAATAEPTPARWSVERARAWYDAQPWRVGCNFLPSTAVNDVEMWQVETFDLVTMDRELGWAADLGFNTVRVFLNYVVWEADASGFRERFGRFLETADRHGIATLVILFDDCFKPEPRVGPQDEPEPGVHNSQWVQSPGVTRRGDPAAWPRLEAYVRDVVSTFAKDSRVLAWELYNEPSASLPLVEAAFRWARAANPTQPVTMTVFGPPEMQQRIVALSDVLCFHNYEALPSVRAQVEGLRAERRPLLCTEFLARGLGSLFQTHLPYFKQERIGCWNWGLVAGRTQTYFPWGSPKGGPEPKLWHHDLLRRDGTAYDPGEIAFVRQITGRLNVQAGDSRYRGWTSHRLANGLVEVQLVPAVGGRVMQYRLGSHDWFWVNPDLAGRPPTATGVGPNGEWLNYGGDKLWPAPQGWDNDAQWPGPPDAVLDGSPHRAEVLEATPEHGAIRLESRPDPRSGIQFVRTVHLRPGTTRVVHEVTMKNIDTRPRRWGIWTVTQLDGTRPDGQGFNPDLTVWCPVNPASHFANGFEVLFGPRDNPTFRRAGNLLRLDYQYRVGKAVLDSHAGWVATVNAATGHAFVQRFKFEPGREYPDGASVELWSSGAGTIRAWGKDLELKDDPRETPFLVEAELISPFAELPPGASYSWRFEWASATVGARFPVCDSSDLGVVAEPLSARFNRGKLELRGRFGVFQPAGVQLAFAGQNGEPLGTQVLPLHASPLAPLVIDTSLKPPPAARSISLMLEGVEGRRLGELARAAVPEYVRPPAVVPSAETAPVTWRYTLEAPASDWFTPGFADRGWKEDAAPFGTLEPQHGRHPRTTWTTPAIWLRRTFDLPAGFPADLALWLHHDEDVEVYLNGVLAARVPGYNAEYEECGIAPEALATLKPGANLVAVHCRQAGGGQYFDLGLVATGATTNKTDLTPLP